MNGHASRKVVKAKVLVTQQLRQQNDLTGVHGKVFGNVKHGLEHVDLYSLDETWLQQYVRIESMEHLFHLRDKCYAGG
jgi:hypothetical protein